MSAIYVINTILSELDIKAAAFAKTINVHPTQIYDLQNGKTKSISQDMAKKITDAYPAFNKSWLLTGEGEMLKYVEKETQEEKRTPVYDAETTGGADGLVASSSEGDNIVGYINSGDWFERKETAIIRHVGESMIEYPDGCWLAVKRVLNPKLLVPGKNYVIETDEFRVTKRIQKGSEKGYIKLYSTNQERYEDGQLIHEPFEIHLSDVRRIFSVLGYVVNQSGEIRLFN